jgi:hypothetical protein
VSGIRGLGGLQAAVATTLTGSVDVHRKTRVPDTSGGQTDTYAKVASLPCSYRPSQFTPRERESAVRVQAYVYWTFTFAANVDVRPTDRLYLGTRRFEVVGGGAHSLGLYSEFTCLEIQ